MTEDTLEEFPIDALFDLLMQSTKELIDLMYKENITAFDAKKAEVVLLQKIIVAKRAEFPPG
jgi:hypothetical protein